MQIQYFTKGGFVIHKMQPDWIAKRSTVSAWFNEDGSIIDAEIVSDYGRRDARKGSPVWNYAARIGQQHADYLAAKKKGNV